MPRGERKGNGMRSNGGSAALFWGRPGANSEWGNRKSAGIPLREPASSVFYPERRGGVEKENLTSILTEVRKVDVISDCKTFKTKRGLGGCQMAENLFPNWLFYALSIVDSAKPKELNEQPQIQKNSKGIDI